MKLNLNLTLKTLGAAALLLGTAGMAQAAGPVSDIATATADLTFAASGKATMEITPRTDLLAGISDGSVTVATFKASASAGTVAFRMTPGTGEFTDTAYGQQRNVTLPGKNAGNTLKLWVHPENGTGTFENPIAVDGWIVSASGVSSLAGRLTAQPQRVSPDTYVVSMDAAVWAE